MLSRLRLDFASVVDNLRDFGFMNAAHDVAVRAANHFVYLRFLMGVVITEPGERPAELAYGHGFADCDRLLAIAHDPIYEMSHPFIHEAFAKGDHCYAIWDDDQLASYGWYSDGPTFMTEDLVVRFDPRYAYMYKGFTHPRYRGQRLHAAGMSLALQSYLDQGRLGLVSYVESTNFSSLKSCYRMGYRDFGRIAIVQAFDRFAIRCSQGCDAYGFTVREAGPPSSAPTPAGPILDPPTVA